MTRAKRLICSRAALLLIVILSSAAYGQEQQADSVSRPARHALGISLGLNDFHIKDQYLSPIIFGGRTFSSGISFHGESEDRRHAIGLRFSKGHLNSDAQPRDVTQYVGYISCLGACKLGTYTLAGRPLDLWLGGGLSSFVTDTDFNTLGQTRAEIYYDQSWYWSHALNIHFSAAYHPSERRVLSVQLSSPLYRLVSRPRNGHHFNSRNQEVTQNFLNAALHGRREFLWENLVLLGEVEYLEPLGDRFSLRGTYWFTYASADTPFTMAMYANQFLLGFDLEF